MAAATLTEHQKAQLENIDCDTLARDTLTADELRQELDKLKDDAEKEKACRAILSTTGTQTAQLIRELSTGTWDNPVTDPKGKEPQKSAQKPNENVEVSTSDLPVAPTTTFNIIRLIQLGYIPMEKPSGIKGAVKWIFYGPNYLNLAGRAKTDTKMLDWAEIKSGVSFRTALEQDITNVEKELAKYKDKTSTYFDSRTSLEKQLQLLESIRNERDPKAVKGYMDDYIKARSAFNLTGGSVGYKDPAARKTQAQLDAEIARAEGKTRGTEDFVRTTEQDLKAMTTKGELDSKGNPRETLDDINKKYDKAIQKKGIELQRELTLTEAAIKQPKINYENAQTAYDGVKNKILELQSKLFTAPIVKPTKPNKDGLFPMTQAEINAELDKLGRIDSRGKPSHLRVGQELYLAGIKLTRAKNVHDPLNAKIERLQKRLGVYKDSLNAKRTKEIDAFNTRKANLEKQLQQAKTAIPNRQEAETRITNLNNEIKRVQAELAVAGISPAKQAQLEGELKTLYGQKNAATIALETAVNSGSKNAKNGTLDSQKAQIENEVAKLHQIDAELKPYKDQIDALHAEAKAAQEAIRNERDPVKAKKLLDEMPAKINGWNSQIGRANETARGILTRAGLNWKNIPEVELRSVLTGNPLLSNMIAHPDGFLAKVTAMEQTAGGQKVMKFAYGGLRLVAVAGAARTIVNDLTTEGLGAKAAVWDAVDAGMGFVGMVPVIGNIASGAWDIGWAAKQLVTGTDINGRQVSTSQSFVRLGFGVVGLIPVVGNIAKGTKTVAHSTQAVRAIDAMSSTANLAMKGAVITQVGTLAYDVVDVTANLVRNPVDTAMKVIRGQEQNGIIFTKPTK